MIDILDELEFFAVGKEWNRVCELIENTEDIATAIFAGKRTALIILSSCEGLDCIRWLLDRGADPNWKDDSGCTPLLATLEAPEGHKTLPVMRLLLQRGANPNANAYLGQTAVHKATAGCLPGHLKLLLEYAGDPFVPVMDELDQVMENAFDIAKRREKYCPEVMLVLRGEVGKEG